MFRKRLREKIGRRYLIGGLIIVTLALIGFVLFSAVRSNDSGGEPGSTAGIEEQAGEDVTTQDTTPQITSRLVRIPEKGWFGGVLAGFAYYFAFPLWLLRLLFVLAVLWWDDASELLILAYILLWIFMPSIDFVPADFIARTG